jgi:phenylpropionate dioxygenase-like ring-hydroxylating dioxygenase large terminal subunit
VFQARPDGTFDSRDNAYGPVNVCRHRCLHLVDKPCNVGRVLRCPYHSRTYTLDGGLLSPIWEESVISFQKLVLDALQ